MTQCELAAAGLLSELVGHDPAWTRLAPLLSHDLTSRLLANFVLCAAVHRAHTGLADAHQVGGDGRPEGAAPLLTQARAQPHSSPALPAGLLQAPELQRALSAVMAAANVASVYSVQHV